MKLRHLVLSATVAGLAAASLVATGTATGAPAEKFNAHSYRFADTLPDGHIVETIDITTVHVYRTAKDYRAVVTYKDLQKRSKTRWLIGFSDDDPDTTSLSATGRGRPPSQAQAVEYRIGPDGKTAVFGYVNGNDGPVVSRCAGLSARPDFAADTISFTIPNACWRLNYQPAQVIAATRLFAKDEPWRSGFEQYFESSGNRGDQAVGSWNWGGQNGSDPRQPGKDALDRNPFYRR